MASPSDDNKAKGKFLQQYALVTKSDALVLHSRHDFTGRRHPQKMKKKTDVSAGGEFFWKEIFSECLAPHSKADMERTLAAGTAQNTPAEETIAAKQPRPWLFLRILGGGITLSAVIFAIFLFNVWYVGYAPEAIRLIAVILPPLVIPFALALLIWEMNIPGNISIWQLFALFLIGALLSMTFTMVFSGFDPNFSGSIFADSIAAFLEEPAKLAAGMILLLLFSRENKVYGLTGMVIGAAVGAGFSGFESAQYVQTTYAACSAQGMSEWLSSIYMIRQAFVRMLTAFTGHTFYCAPYIGALALHMEDGRLRAASFLNRDFLLTFVLSVFCHFFWNMEIPGRMSKICVCLLITAALWLEVFAILRKSLRQAVLCGREAARRAIIPQKIRLVGTAGPLAGATWDFPEERPLLIGRAEECGLSFPSGTGGVSRNHCTIQKRAEGWVVRDEGSTYGTFVNGRRLAPGGEQLLHEGDTICLGSTENVFRILGKE